MPGPGRYVTDPKTGNIKRKPGSVKRDPSGNVTAVDTVGGWVSPAGGPSSTSYPTAAGAVAKTKEVSATSKLKEFRKQAEKIVDSKVEFDTYDGLPKLKSAASSVAHASAKVGRASGSGKAKTTGGPRVPKGQLTELKKIEGSKFNAMDPALKKNSVTGLSEKKQKAFKKATGDSTLDDTLKELASVDSFKASAGHMKDALDDVVSGEKSPGQAYASVLLPGQDNSISPADRANVALTLFGAAGALKGAKVASKVPGAVRAEKAADESLNTYKALKAAGRTQLKKTRSGRTIVKVRDASTSKAGKRLKAAGYTAAGVTATGGGYTVPVAQGILDANVAKSLATGARVTLGMPALFATGGLNVALTGKRAAMAPFQSDPNKSSSDYILGPAEQFAKEQYKGGKEMIDVYASKDPKRVSNYTEEVGSYFPVATGLNVFSRGFMPLGREVGGKVTKVARETKDTQLRKAHKQPERHPDNPAPPIFPQIARAKSHVKSKRSVARSGTAIIQAENIGLNDMKGEIHQSNWGAAKKVDKEIGTIREGMYSRYPGQKNIIDSVTGIPALAHFLGAEARVSQRSVPEALAQLTKLEDHIRSNYKTKDGAPMLLQIEVLKQHPYLMKRPPEKLTAKMLREMSPTERKQTKAARALWNIVDARNKGVKLTEGTDRSLHAREVSDAFTINALERDTPNAARHPEFDAEQAWIDNEREYIVKGLAEDGDPARAASLREALAKLDAQENRLRAKRQSAGAPATNGLPGITADMKSEGALIDAGRAYVESRSAPNLPESVAYQRVAKDLGVAVAGKSNTEIAAAIGRAVAPRTERKGELLPPEFKLDELNAAEQTAIDTARKSVRSDQSKTRTLYKDLSVQRERVRKLREGEDARARSLDNLDAERKLTALDAERTMLRDARKQPPDKVQQLRSEAASLRAEANKTKGKGAPAKRKALRAQAAKKDKAANAAMRSHRNEITRLLGRNSTARKAVSTKLSERGKGRPGDLARAEAKLARMEDEFSGHTEKVKSDILSVRDRQNTLDARLTPEERKAVLASLPEGATVSEKKVALATARKDKMAANQERDVAPIRNAFNEEMKAAMEKYGIEPSSFIVHESVDSRSNVPTAGSPVDRLGAAKDKRRTGELLKTGAAIFDNEAAINTIRSNAKRVEDARQIRSLTEDHALTVDLGNGPQNTFTKDQILQMEKEGRLPPGMEAVRAALMSDEDTVSGILDSSDPASALDTLLKQDRAKQLDIQALDAKGHGDRFYLMDHKAVTYTLDSMKALHGLFKWMNWINGVGSRLVLNTSFAWMMAQPVAEMLVLLMHDPNPARLIRAMKVVKDAHKDPDLMKALARGSDAALAREGLTQSNKAYQGSVFDSANVLKRSPIGLLARDFGTLRMPAYIDRAKGGWIRKVGYAAEVDRELNSTVRQFGRAVAGTMDDIQSVSGELRKMDRKAQLEWLDTPEGRLAAEKFQSNLDGMLGNWGALGPIERQVAQLVFFYPFMRFSLDWMFHTFPKRHPVRYAVFTSASAWNAQQVEEFLGHKPSFFTGWAEAPIYGGPNGEITSTKPFNRAAPGGNTLVELLGESDSLASFSKGFSPALGIPFRTLFNYDSFGKPKESDPFSNEQPSLFNDLSAIPGSLKEQAIGMTFPTRFADRLGLLGNEREPQPGDEAPTHIGPLTVDTYGLRSGFFPFLGHDKKQATVGAAVSDAYDKRGEAYGQSNAGGDRYSELNKRFEGMADWARPTAAESKDYREYTDLKKQRAEGTKNIAKQEAKLRALYRQEGIPAPDNLKSDATVADWAQKGGTLSKKEQAAIDKALRPLSPDRIEAAARTTTPKAIKATPKSKRMMANKILDAKEALTSAGGIKGLSSPGYDQFVNALSKEIGGALSPKVLAAWTTQEGGNTSKGDWNLLNIGQADSGPYGPALEAEKWSNPTTAAAWTAKFLKNEYGGPSESIAGILGNAKGKNDLEQIAVIAGTDWAGDPNYQSNITRNYESLDVESFPGKDNAAAKQKFARLVRRGKAMGVYEDAAKKKTIDWSNAEKAKRFVRGAAEVLPKKKIDKWLLPSGSGSGGIENIYKLNPVLARQLIKVARESGEPITVDSGQRSTEYQANIDSGTNPKAPPGLSSHQFGMAADTSMTPAQVEIAAKYGIEHGEAGAGVADPPHTELTDPALIKEALKYGPIRSSYLPAGVADSVGDVDSWEGGDAVVINPGSVMDQVKAARAPDPVATGSTSQTAGSTTTTSFPSATAPSGNTSDRQAPYNQRMNKWQKLMDFRADPTGTTGATTGVASDSTLPDLSAAEQIANLPSTKRKKNYA